MSRSRFSLGSRFSSPLAPVIAAALMLFAAASVRAQPSVDVDLRAEAPSPDEYPALLRRLKSDQFVEREEAMHKLAAAGVGIVEPLTLAIETGDREFVTRGGYILHRVAMREDRQQSEPAYQALRSMQDSKRRLASGVARRHINEIHEARQQVAIEHLVNKGAELKEEFVIINALGQAEPAKTLEIGALWKGQDDDLKWLSWLYNIRYLAFKSDRIRGPWLRHAAKMESLESLSVRGGELDDSGIQGFVAGKPSLRILELKYVPVSDASLPKFQADLPNLTSLKLYGTKVTNEAAESLRRQMPRLELDFRQGGFLGVGCQTHQLGCHVARVQPDSAADRAGFIPGDVIISYAGKPVPDFDALTKLISSNKVEDKVRIELIRNVQTSAIIVACRKESLKIETSPHRLGAKFEAMADDSPLRRPRGQLNRDPFSIGDLRKGDVVFRINGREIPEGKTVDEIYFAVCDEVAKGAVLRAQAELTRNPDAPKDETERKKLIDKIVEQEMQEERILIQFARGGKFLTKDVNLGAWD